MQTFEERRFDQAILASPDQILVATDLDDGDYLIPHIVAQAKASNSHVTLVHGVLPANLMLADPAGYGFVVPPTEDSELQVSLDAMAAKIREHGISCDAVLEHGYAVDVIRKHIELTHANRLIMGTHGRGKLGQMVLGSVASDLIRVVDIPILAIGPRARITPGHETPRSILHPVSLRGHYLKTAEFAMDLAQACRAELTLLHVLDPDDREIPELGMSVWAKDALSALAPNGEDLVPPIYTSVVYGDRVEEILNAASRTDADWIVLGVEERVPFWPFQDSTAYKIMVAADRPVLSFRYQRRAAGQEQAYDGQLTHAIV